MILTPKGLVVLLWLAGAHGSTAAVCDLCWELFDLDHGSATGLVVVFHGSDWKLLQYNIYLYKVKWNIAPINYRKKNLIPELISHKDQILHYSVQIDMQVSIDNMQQE